MKRIKKSALILICTAFIGSAVFFNFGNIQEAKSENPTWYEIEYTTSTTSTGFYLITTCTNIPGSACDSPGSHHRTNISWVLGFLGL